jgi:orotate phosphoribosyltransferase
VTPERVTLLRFLRSCAPEISPPGTYFTLPGGGRSTTYINVKSACMNCFIQDKLGSQLTETLETFGPLDAIAGIALGGCHLASLATFHVWNRPQRQQLHVFYVRKVAIDHGGTPSFVLGPVFEGARVVLLDDIVSTGKSVMDAAVRLRDAGCDVRGVLAVIDKRRERPETLPDGMEIKSLFTIDELIYGEGAGQT